MPGRVNYRDMSQDEGLRFRARHLLIRQTEPWEKNKQQCRVLFCREVAVIPFELFLFS